MSRIHFMHWQSPIGRLWLVGDGAALTEIRLPRKTAATVPPADWTPGGVVLQETVAQLRAYFRGDLRTFDLPLAPVGTDFQRQVWGVLQSIEYGTTRTYGELAERIGRPTAARAVGAANARNPLPIVIPCHRVIGSNGTLTGYAGGLRQKEFLLRLEGAACAAS